MSKKSIFKLLTILIGVILISLSLNKVQAREITSVFSGEVVSRQTLQTLAIDNELDTKVVPIKLGIQQSEYKTNGGNTYWSIKDTKGANKDLYCLNLSRGFGNPDGIITVANSTKDYLSEYNLKELTDSNYEKYTGLSKTTKNKILWILNNSLTSTQDLKDILTAASEKIEESTKKDFIQEDMIANERELTKLTFEDVKMVQQIAIWHYTNPDSVFDNTISGICNSEGKQISGLMEENIEIYIDGLKVDNVWNGEIKQAKLNALYKYFIDGAESGNSEITVPEMNLSNQNVMVNENEGNYIVGPFVLTGTNTKLVKEIIPTVNVNYTLLNSSKIAVKNNDFTEVIENEEFYLQIPKSEINKTTQISINLKYTYNGKEIVLLTDKDDYLNTQPVVLIQNINLNSEITTNAKIELTQVKVNKVWEDNNNQDGKRPQSITVNLLADGKVVDTKVISENNEGKWEHTFTKLLKYKSGKEVRYTITENKVDKYTTQINGYTIKNIYNPETIEKTVTKVWDDNNNQDGKRAQYGVTLKANGVPYGEEVILNANQTSYTWEDLPKYSNGEEIVYTVEETTIPNGYSATYEDTFTIRNTYTPGKVNLKVIKNWQDENDKAEIRPEFVVVKLYKTIENEKDLVNEQRLDENNKWMYTWTGLDQKSNGKDILYSVEEIAVEGYTTTYSDTNFKNTNEITITNTHIPEVITGKYDVVLRKVDENGNILNGSTFEINEIEYKLPQGETTILEDAEIISEADIPFRYSIKETIVPEGYNGIEDTVINIKAKVKQEGNNYRLTRALLEDEEGNTITDENISIKLEGQTIVIEVKNTPVEEQFDLALRKFITKVNDIEYSREPIVETSKLGTIIDGKTVTTATYKHSKQPIAVQKGDVVTYTIRVYNEGEIDGYVETITDHLPDHLLPILSTVDGIDAQKYKNEIEFNEARLWQQIDNPKNIFTKITSKSNSDLYSEYTGLTTVTDTKIEAYVKGSNKLDYIDVQIKCLVADTAVSYEYLTNIAEITDAQDINGNKTDGLDSSLGNVEHSNLSDYKNNDALNSSVESYILGQEDDDDFEKLVVREFDLALRKFITKVNEVMHVRTPIVDTSKLGTTVNGKTITTATYTHTKDPVIVKTGDIVTYTIRIFNEGTISGFANEITDDMPKGLEFLPEDDLNKQYGWKMLDKDGNQTTDITEAVILVTDYLSDKDEKNIIQAVKEENGVKTLDYKDIEIRFKVVAKAEKLKDNLIINEAQISADSDRDIDSIPNRDEKYDYTTGKNEDDIDYEPIKLQYFDLALRKFITKVNTTDYNNRYPEVIYGDDGSITYNHTKDPVLVTTGDIVTYTIRVYNEGEIAGYATGIKDNLPEGLAFDPENETNKQYGWKMLDKDGNVTEDIEKVVAFSTDYLKDQLIEALVVENGAKVLSYKDVKIAFKVTEPNTSDRVLVNTAQILEDSDDDIDSVPGNDVLTEDDIDREYVRVQYFDLSLKKWVTKTQVTYNGKTTTTKTGFTEDSEDIAKVDLVAKQMTKTTVKFAYNIKVTNEGELPGYATEIKDYIPKGLKFVAADNKDWKEIKDGVVVTDKLKDTLLNPGESATVEIVLTWKNSTTNTGLKTNYAEISADSAEDKDSIPDNYNFTEDDIDDAQVILSIKTAGPTTYIGLVLGTVAILAGGIFLIKKYVLE